MIQVPGGHLSWALLSVAQNTEHNRSQHSLWHHPSTAVMLILEHVLLCTLKVPPQVQVKDQSPRHDQLQS